jgi:hypothetical protein
MPLQNWPAVVPPPLATVGAVVGVVVIGAVVTVAVVFAVAPGLGVALLPQADAVIASAASTSGSLVKDLDIPLGSST